MRLGRVWYYILS